MIELLQQRLAQNAVDGAEQQEQVLKEMLQELTLYALWREGFFNIAAFQGGTCLRILYGLPRFSEDLDFILQSPDPNFSWARVLEGVAAILAEFGIAAELVDRTRADRDVEPFLSAMERRSLAVWGEPLFSERVQQLCGRV